MKRDSAAVEKAEEQVAEVAWELKRLNPDFNGKVTPTIVNGVVMGLSFVTDNVTDISPVRALTGLRSLNCNSTHVAGDKGLIAMGQLRDLSPLQGLHLTHFSCWSTKVSDLSPMKDMKLTYLDFGLTPVADLSPLKDMKLRTLRCVATPVADLSPLKNMPLTNLDCFGTRVSDLSPLKGMSLTNLVCNATKVTDLSPLKGMPLKELVCNYQRERDAEIVRSIKSLKTINGKPAADFWKEEDAKQPPKKP